MAITAGFVIWFVALLAWIATLKFLEYDFGCISSDSDSGDEVTSAAWQWFPPGMRCQYVGRVVNVDEPPTARIGMILCLIAWFITMLVIALTVRRERAKD